MATIIQAGTTFAVTKNMTLTAVYGGNWYCDTNGACAENAELAGDGMTASECAASPCAPCNISSWEDPLSLAVNDAFQSGGGGYYGYDCSQGPGLVVGGLLNKPIYIAPGMFVKRAAALYPNACPDSWMCNDYYCADMNWETWTCNSYTPDGVAMGCGGPAYAALAPSCTNLELVSDSEAPLGFETIIEPVDPSNTEFIERRGTVFYMWGGLSIGPYTEDGWKITANSRDEALAKLKAMAVPAEKQFTLSRDGGVYETLNNYWADLVGTVIVVMKGDNPGGYFQNYWGSPIVSMNPYLIRAVMTAYYRPRVGDGTGYWGAGGWTDWQYQKEVTAVPDSGSCSAGRVFSNQYDMGAYPPAWCESAGALVHVDGYGRRHYLAGPATQYKYKSAAPGDYNERETSFDTAVPAGPGGGALEYPQLLGCEEACQAVNYYTGEWNGYSVGGAALLEVKNGVPYFAPTATLATKCLCSNAKCRFGASGTVEMRVPQSPQCADWRGMPGLVSASGFASPAACSAHAYARFPRSQWGDLHIRWACSAGETDSYSYEALVIHTAMDNYNYYWLCSFRCDEATQACVDDGNGGGLPDYLASQQKPLRTCQLTCGGGAFDTAVGPDGKLEITGVKSAFQGNTTLNIPLAIGGVDVVRVQAAAFEGNTSLVSITMSANLVEVGEGAFRNCTTLVTVTAPGLAIVGAEAFAGCSSLTSVTMADSPVLGSDSFAAAGFQPPADIFLWNGTTEIVGVRSGVSLANKTLIIPAGVASIGAHAFAGQGMIHVILPANVVNVGQGAFKNCASLSTVAGTSLGVVGDSAFRGCAALASVGCPMGSVGPDAFRGCALLAGVAISGTHIHDRAFMGCAALPAVTAAALTSIGDHAFYKSGLAAISLPATVTRIGAGAFAYSAVASLDVPEGCAMDSSAVSGCALLRHVTLPGNQALASGMFHGLPELLSVTVGHSTCSVAAIPDSFVMGCPKLATVALVNCQSAISVGAMAFKGSAALTGVSGGSAGFGVIGAYAFAGCASLAGLPSAAGLTVAEYAFNGCAAMQSVGPLASIGSYAFQGCAALSTVAFRPACASIADHAFMNSGLTNLVIPATVTAIGVEALRGCVYLHTLDTGGVTTLPRNLFNAMEVMDLPYNYDWQGVSAATGQPPSLSTLVIGAGVTEIPQGLFRYCRNLSSLTLGANVKYVRSEAFYNCAQRDISSIVPTSPGLKGVALPAGMLEVNASAFGWCSQMKTLTMHAGPLVIGSSAFAACGYYNYSSGPSAGTPMGLTAVTIPVGVTVDPSAFSSCGTAVITYA